MKLFMNVPGEEVSQKLTLASQHGLAGTHFHESRGCLWKRFVPYPTVPDTGGCIAEES